VGGKKVIVAPRIIHLEKILESQFYDGCFPWSLEYELAKGIKGKASKFIEKQPKHFGVTIFRRFGRGAIM
jgi:hypothetical protein